MKVPVTFLLLTALLVVTGCATSQAKWMTNLEAVYPESRYLAATGSGDTRADAEASAAASLSRRFEVKIDATTVSRQSSTSTTAGGKVSTVAVSEFDQTVGLRGAQGFLNLQFSSPVTDDNGVLHVVAYLEKASTARLYSARINEDLEQIRALSVRSSSASGALPAYALADAAVSLSGETAARIAQLRLLQPSTAAGFETSLDQQTLLKKRDAAALNLGYRAELEGDPDGRLAGILKTALAVYGIPFAANGKLLVKGSLKLEPVTVNATYKSVEWTLSVSLFDEKGATLATVYKLARENGLSDAEARTIAWREVEKRLTKDLSAALQAYGDSLVKL